MKNFTLPFLIAVLFSGLVKAQCLIPENSFENWVTTTDTTILGTPVNYEHINDPNWFSISDMFGYQMWGSPAPVMNKSIDAQSGSLALKVDVQAGNDGDVMGSGPCSTRHQNFNGYYKFTGSTPDSFLMMAFLIQGDAFDFLFGGGDSTTAIGYAQKTITATAISYTNFSIPFKYNNGLIPDTFIVAFFVLNNSATNKNALVDNISFSGIALGIEDQLSTNRLQVYPNPTASDILHITIPGNKKNAVINLFDVSGKRMQTITTSSLTEKIQIESYLKGVYIIEVITATESYHAKFIKE